MPKEGEPELIHTLLANGFMLEVFMLEVSLTLARGQPDPEAWARTFISQMHKRLDVNEALTNGSRYPLHENARAGFDRLGRALTHVLKQPAP